MTTPPSPNSSSTTTPLTELTSITHLLHLTHHRNKNQHRLAKWWKAFSILRRQVGKLVAEVEVLERCVKFSSSASTTTTATAGGLSGNVNAGKADGKRKKGEDGDWAGEGESKYLRAARETVEEHVEFMEVWVLPKCFLAFSNLVADNQYAALGLMLMATLARVRSVLRVLGNGKEKESGNESGDEEGKGDAREVLAAEPMVDARETDLGEVVGREEIVGIEGEDGGLVVKKIKKIKKKKRRERAEEEESDAGAETVPAPAKRPKKKRKKGDAFDDLFAGLI
ncbi:hypothetical protein BKA61DRAFT_655519 [Leptodontidium sp. MPI-SDFR-AT-0119]|nr:hypothetical protein BKA61DRAFT_655519 [Leptodontidium sp. MPI-SDFR-AT-0119]